MKKQHRTKLILTSETVRALSLVDTARLNGVVGGRINPSIQTACLCDTDMSCESACLAC